MLRALRVELAYCRPWLLGGLGIAAGVVVLISVVFSTVGKDGPPAAAGSGMRGMFLIMTPIIVGYIAQATLAAERRARLLLAGSVTPRQLAAMAVLLPTALFGIGVLAAGLVVGAEALRAGRLEPEAVHLPAYVGAMMFAIGAVILAAQEAGAARRQRRLRAAALGSAAFVITVLMLAALFVVSLWGFPGWIALVAAHLVVAAVAMAAAAALYAGRTDFTR